jgi:hypothetical protein
MRDLDGILSVLQFTYFSNTTSPYIHSKNRKIYLISLHIRSVVDVLKHLHTLFLENRPFAIMQIGLIHYPI